jgi:hypothetical protein
MAQEVPYITIKKNIHAKTSNIDNLVQQQRNLGFPITKKPPVQEYITIPFPDFCTIFYEITIWTQFESQMNEVIEKIFYNYDHLDSFVMYSEYDNQTKKGNGSRFVGFRDGSVTPKSNTEEFSDKERVIKYTYTIKVPTYLILDPKDETLAYGRAHGDSKKDDNSKYVYKSQNPVSVQLKEELVSSQVVDALENVGVDVFGNQQRDEERQNLFNLLSSVQGGSGGGGTSPTFDIATPQPISIVGAVGTSGRIPNSDHVHAHGDLPGGSLHPVVSILSAGFVPALSGATDGYALLKTGSSASWAFVAGGGGSTQVTGSDNFFVNQVLQVSGSLVNPVAHLILSSSVGSRVTVSGNLNVLGNIVSNPITELITASGSTIDTATPISISSSLVHINNRTANNAGVILPVSAAYGSTFYIVESANPAQGHNVFVYPPSGSTFFGYSTNGNMYLSYKMAGKFTKFSGTTWLADIFPNVGADNSQNIVFYQTLQTQTQPFSAGGGINAYTSIQLINANANITLTDGSQKIYNNSGHLTLSSSVGSTTTVSGNLKVTGDIITNFSSTTVDTTAVVVDSFSNTSYRTMKYIFSISSGSSYQCEEILLMHSGSSVDYAEFAILYLPTASKFIGFTASITGSTVNIIASGSKAGNAVKFIRNPIGV